MNKPPPDPPRPLPYPVYQKDPPFLWMFGAFVVVVFACAIYAGRASVDRPMKRGVAIPPPECGWSATLVCDDVPGVECRWDRRWKCGYGVPWPNVIVRQPLTEEIIRERYP